MREFDRLFTMSEAAPLCGYTSGERLADAARRGVVSAKKRGGHWIITESEVLRIQSLMTPTLSPEEAYIRVLESENRRLKTELLAKHRPPVKASAPSSLSFLDGRLNAVSVYPSHPPCIYFLIEGEEVVYVGQSICLEQRLATHSREKAFDRVAYLQVEREDLNAVESAFIRYLKPRLNGLTGLRRVDVSDALGRIGVDAKLKWSPTEKSWLWEIKQKQGVVQ